MTLTDSILELARPVRFSELAGNTKAKALVTGLLRSGSVKPGFLFSGDIGTGKTTLARITARAIVCRQRQGVEPCGHCDACAYSPHHTALWGEGISVRNCASYESRSLQKDLEDARYAWGSPFVIVLDEFHRANSKIFDPLLTWLEDDTANLVLLAVTPEPAKVDRALAQRLYSVKLAPPTTSEALEFLKSVRDRLELQVTDPALEAICHTCGNVLRDCLKLLRQEHAMAVLPPFKAE